MLPTLHNQFHMRLFYCIRNNMIIGTLSFGGWVSGIHSLILSLMIWTSLHQSLNQDLKHSSTEGPISINNHFVTLTAPAIRLIGWRTACFKICLLTYLLTFGRTTGRMHILAASCPDSCNFCISWNGYYSIFFLLFHHLTADDAVAASRLQLDASLAISTVSLMCIKLHCNNASPLSFLMFLTRSLVAFLYLYFPYYASRFIFSSVFCNFSVCHMW